MRETSNSLSKQNSQQPKQFRGDDKKVMKKSLLALVLAFSLVLSVAQAAFAATPSDVVGKPVQSAVEELSALGILSGYEDGTFKPDNSITRAELAKIVVIATGNASAATLMQGVTPAFKDVKANVWYTGYINVAATKGFIQGYNGNFRPSDNVKFEEVTAIIVRALGYQDKYLNGAWPYNVLLKADEVGLFSGIDIAAGTLANRGTVAELTSNSLAATLVGYDADGNQVDVSLTGKTLTGTYTAVPLINKLGFTEEKIVTAVALDSKKVNLNGTSVPTADTFFVTGGKKLADLLGHTVNVLWNKDKSKVIAITDAQSAGNIITGTSEKRVEDILDNTPVDITVKGNKYATTSDVIVYDNTDEILSVNYDIEKDASVQLMLDASGKVQAVLVNNWSADSSLVEVVTYKDYSRVITSGGSFKVTNETAISLDGKVAAIADLKEFDIVQAIVNEAGNAVKLEATRKSISGKLESVGSDEDGITYKVDGKNYLVTVSANDLDGSDVGSTFTYYLNKDGKIAYYNQPVATENNQYAVIYSVTAATRIIDGEVSPDNWKKVVYYSLKDSKKVTTYTKDVDTTTALNGTLVELKFNKDGEIDLSATPGAVNLASTKSVGAVTASKLTVNDGSDETNYILNSNTIYLKVKFATNAVDSTVEVITAASVTKNSEVVVKDEAGVAKFVVVTTAGVSNELPKVQGLYLSRSMNATSSTESTYSVKLNVKGETKTFEVDRASYIAFGDDLEKYDIVTLEDGATDNSIYEVTNLEYDSREAESATLAVNNSAKTITVTGNNAGTYLITDATQIFTVKADFTKLDQGTFTDLRVAADGNNYGDAAGKYKVVVIASGNKYGANNEAGVILVIAQ